MRRVRSEIGGIVVATAGWGRSMAKVWFDPGYAENSQAVDPF